MTYLIHLVLIIQRIEPVWKFTVVAFFLFVSVINTFLFIKRKNRLGAAVINSVFLTYVFLVLVFTILSRESNYFLKYDLNIIIHYYRIFLGDFPYVLELLKNLFLFFPFGLLFPLFLYYNSKWFTYYKRLTILSASIFSFIIEATQLVSGQGVFELSDLLNNTLGAVFGLTLFMALLFLYTKIHRLLMKSNYHGKL
ncbi:MAG: VanZ family protein [Ruminococcus sp.]|nr:VanZ family protein [Ruminococcus sp.]